MTSVANAWNNLLDRHRARLESHRVESNEDDDDLQEQQHQHQHQHSVAVVTTDEEAAHVRRTAADRSHQVEEEPVEETEDNSDDDDDDDDDELSVLSVQRDEEMGNSNNTTTTTAGAETGNNDIATATQTMTLAELEEERELARRRSSACVMFAVFVLFRLWIEAIQEGDFGLLMLCLVGTSWTARWVRHNREREEELDRRIAQYLEQQQNGTATGAAAAATTTLDRNDLRMLSFQAQLALAIMESQRQMMMNGGYGNSDESNQTPGVSDEAKSRWEHFQFHAAASSSSSAAADASKSHHHHHHHKHKLSATKGSYGSVSLAEDALMKPGKTVKNNGDGNEDDEEPHCSICLCEYEDGETLVKLPCSHVYHEECINSWTSNHVKCPLCNFDLETAPPASTNDDSIV